MYYIKFPGELALHAAHDKFYTELTLKIHQLSFSRMPELDSTIFCNFSLFYVYSKNPQSGNHFIRNLRLIFFLRNGALILETSQHDFGKVSYKRFPGSDVFP